MTLGTSAVAPKERRQPFFPQAGRTISFPQVERDDVRLLELYRDQSLSRVVTEKDFVLFERHACRVSPRLYRSIYRAQSDGEVSHFHAIDSKANESAGPPPFPGK